MNEEQCGCCEGIEILTPLPMANRPGLEDLIYRVGTHATFLETMKAQLSNAYLKISPEAVDSWLLRADDLRHPGRLAVKLRDDRDTFTRYIWQDVFSSDLRSALTNYDKTSPPSADLRQKLLSGLNQALRAKLYKSERVARLPLTKTIRNLARQETLSNKDIVRLNRLLLEVAFPREIVPRQQIYPLRALTTRESSDPAIALLDAWATVAHVLTFYQERIANEGYLLTSTQRRSILELARLVGYRLRPGVAASTYLAFTLDEGYEVKIAEGTQAQSVPLPGELPQIFETAEPVLARTAWNALKPRLSQPQIMTNATHSVFLKGLGVNLQPYAPILVIATDEAGEADPIFRRVHAIEPEEADNRIKVLLIGELNVDELSSLVAAVSVPAVPGPYSAPTNPSPDDGAENVAVGELTLLWHDSAPSESATYTVYFGTGDPLDSYSVEDHQTQFIPSAEVPPIEITPGTTYYWYVTREQGTSILHSPLWHFTTASGESGEGEDTGEDDLVDGVPEPPQPDPVRDSERAQAVGSLVTNIHARLTTASDTRSGPLANTLKDLNLSADRLEKEIQIELTPLTHVYDPSGQRLVNALASIHPSAYDYTPVTEWIKGLQLALTNIRQQLGLRRAVPSTPGGPFKEQYIDQQKVSELINHRRTGQAKLSPPGNAGTAGLGQREFEQILADLRDLLDFLLDGEQEEADKIVAIEEQIRRVDDLRFVFDALWTSDNPVSKWLGNATDPDNPGLYELLKAAITDVPPPTTVLPSLRPLLIPPSRPPDNALRLALTIGDVFRREGDIASRVLTTLQRQLQGTFYQAWAGVEGAPLSPLQGFEVLRAKATPFGAKAPLKPIYDDQGVIIGHKEWPLFGVSVRLTFKKTKSDSYYAPPLEAEIYFTRDAETRQVAGGIKLEGDDEDTRKLQGQVVTTRLTTKTVTISGAGTTVVEAVTIVIGGKTTIVLTGKDTLAGKNTVTIGDYKRGFRLNDTRVDTINGSLVTITTRSKGSMASLVIEDLAISLPSIMRDLLTLDADYDLRPGSWLVIEWPEDVERPNFKDDNPNLLIRQAEKVSTITKSGYGQVSQLILDKEWLGGEDWSLSLLRKASIYVQNERLPLAEQPLTADVGGDTIQLDGLYDGLEAGRWLVVSGERTDIPGTTGLKASELVMLAGVTQSVEPNIGEEEGQPGEEGSQAERPGEKTHTTIHLANRLNYTYQRYTVTIYGNVVKATHGETRREVLGSGDSSQALQSFSLKQSPLTYLVAATPAGAQSTLEVRGNDILWHEADNLIWLEANDRGYVTRTNNDDQVTMIFGDGQHGARLPTGIENVTAVYRTGLGKVGNVAAEQISLLSTRPLGVKEVINPMAASGGADREGRDQGRRNAPLAVMALDRLVSTQDYADLTRTYAGISKASAVRLSDGRQEVIHVTIAGVDDIAIDQNSDLYQNLSQTLRQFGPPHQPIVVSPRELMLLIISADVRLLPDYQWESVAPAIRTALLDAFSFERRQLGQDVLLSEVIRTIQHMPGVAYTDVDILDSVSENIPPAELEALVNELTEAKERIMVKMGRIQASHRIKRQNETLSSIAQRYGITEVDLRQLNPGVENPKKDSEVEVENWLKTVLNIPRQISPAQLAYLSPDVPDMLILSHP